MCPWGEDTESHAEACVIIIVALAAGATAFSALLAVALGRVAGQADREMERDLARRRGRERFLVPVDSYAGLAAAHLTISCEPSITVPSSRTSVGTQRLPVSSCTSRRPRVRLNTPGSGAKP